MEIITTTPFGRRPLSATLMAHATAAQTPADLDPVDKWTVLNDLCVARVEFGLTDRDMTVLNALLTFYQGSQLDPDHGLIVFPSNRALSSRAHGMAESTLRRHLAALVHSGVIRRHDSPNGKRYARRDQGGVIALAFGFDLGPLLERAAEIAQAAVTVKAANEALKRAREAVTLLKRDAVKLATYGQETVPDADWSQLLDGLLEIHKHTRRKLDLQALGEVRQKLAVILTEIREMFPKETKEMNGSDIQNERHFQNSKTDIIESESCKEEKDKKANDAAKTPQNDIQLPVHLVIKAAPDILPYADGEIHNWEQLHQTACRVRSMMGISLDAWQDAETAMGPLPASVVLVCILQRISQIRNPGGYLRALTLKAATGGFSPGPMVMALLNSSKLAA